MVLYPAEAREAYFLQRVWTRPEAHKGSYTMEMVGILPGVRATGT
jgi:hypothetical protein